MEAQDSKEYLTVDDGVPTFSSKEQSEVEGKVKFMLHAAAGEDTTLLRAHHVTFLKKGLKHLSEGYECLDASRPWLCYWILHSLSLLGSPISPEMSRDVVDFLSRCQSAGGGFGGGPGQLPHLAPTYAAVLALCTLGTEEAFKAIDRPALQRYLLEMHQEDGSYVMHRDGEKDIRAVYCSLVVAVLTNVLCPELVNDTAEWIRSCQTYEGGFSAVPGTEAHGGYTFCGFASLVILDKTDYCDLRPLLRWVARKQMKVEGGFQGRTNKLVDGCYSFWQGGIFPLVYMALNKMEDKDHLHPELWHFNQEALQRYVLYCCQSPQGGLLDKPGKTRDFYHTCYCLSGLSLSQHCFADSKTINVTEDDGCVLNPIHPVFNITMDKAPVAHNYYSKLAVPKILQSTDEV